MNGKNIEKFSIIIQARLGSTRFKNKVLAKINKEILIKFLIKRLKKCKQVDKIIVAVPDSKDNDLLSKYLEKENYCVFRGSENNVLRRYFECAKHFKLKNIVRITADCPLVDPKLIDDLIKKFQSINVDYLSNTINRTYPDGMDIEIFNFKALNLTRKFAIQKYDLEHVTPYMQKTDRLKVFNQIYTKGNFSKLRITIDYKEDLIKINKVCKMLGKKNFSLGNIIKLSKSNSELFRLNKKMKNKKKISLKYENNHSLWENAKEIIAGGNMLFSKRPDTILPGKWPAYFKSAKGCKITDVDGNTYTDLSLMGVGTNILGYANKSVDKSVINRLKNGNMSTLNCVEEVKLSKKLLEMNKWASKVKFARSGGEANAIAVRIARAFNDNRDSIAFCGYHGWHDWYLAANIKDKNNLNNHLISGLKIGGVQKNLKNTVYPFKYNDFKSLEKLINSNKKIGIIKMEVVRNELPKNNFLKKVRNLATKNKIILIFDECTSGFRESFGGIYKKFKVEPDILILGKALGNGYAITAVLGKNKIMKSVNKTFISSTFWTESIGPTAALKTLEIMEKTQSWKYITSLGKYIKKNWVMIAKKNKIKIKIRGIDALCSFYFDSKNHNAFKTFITQEMLKKKIFATNSIYVSVSHNKKILKKYFLILNKIFKIIYKCQNGDDIFRYLETKPPTNQIGRLN